MVKIESRGPSALDNYRNKTNPSSMRNSPQLATQQAISPSVLKGNQRPSNESSKQDYISNLDDDNEFMPLMKLDSTG